MHQMTAFPGDMPSLGAVTASGMRAAVLHSFLSAAAAVHVWYYVWCKYFAVFEIQCIYFRDILWHQFQCLAQFAASDFEKETVATEYTIIGNGHATQ